VLLVDLDGKFDTLRLLKILTTRINAAVSGDAAARTETEAGRFPYCSCIVYQHSPTPSPHPWPGHSQAELKSERGTRPGKRMRRVCTGTPVNYAQTIRGRVARPWGEVEALTDAVYVECMGRGS
jgi:hypothetical protein